MANAMLEARCHCGAVRISLPAGAAGVLACHCDDCQRLHGNFNAFLAAARTDLVVTGEAAIHWYQSSAEAERGFCGTCGARVAKRVNGGSRWLVSAGLLTGPSGMHIIRNLWAESKPDWYDLPPA